MVKIKFETGQIVNFEGNPTPEDIEEVAQKLGIKKKRSLGGEIIRDIARPAIKLARQAEAVVDVARNDKDAYKPRYNKFLGETIAPISVGSGNFKEDVRGLKQSVGLGLELGSYLPVGSGVTGIGKATLKGAIKQGAITGAREGAIGGGLYGLGRGLQEDKSLGQVAGQTALGALTGFGAGGIIGGTLPIPKAIARELSVKGQMARYNKSLTEFFTGTKMGTKLISKEANYGKDTAKFLTDYVDIFGTPKVENGKFSGGEMSGRILENAQKLEPQLNDLLKSSGKIIDLDDVEKQVISSIRSNSQFKKQGVVKRAIQNVLDSFDDYKATYGTRVQLDILNEIKQGQWTQKYPKLTESDTLKAETAYQFGKVVKKIIEKESGDSEVVRTLNNFLGDHYSALKTLSKMEGNAIKGGRFSRWFIRLFGVIAGAKGGALGSLAGALSADQLANVLQNTAFTNPMRRLIISKYKSEAPDVLEKALQIVQKNKASRLLPQKTSTQAVENTINLPTSARETNLGLDEVKNTYLGSRSSNQRNISNPIIADKNITPSIVSQVKEKVKSIPNKQGGFIQAYKGEKDLTTKILKDLEGKTTVSKQYILDATNRGELKQVERDLIRDILEKETGGTSKDPLIQEAKKYKSAEEFVKAQGTPVYTGKVGNVELDYNRVAQKGNQLPYGVHFTPDESIAKSFASGETKGMPTGSKGVVESATISAKNPFDVSATGNNGEHLFFEGSKQYNILQEIAKRDKLGDMSEIYSKKSGGHFIPKENISKYDDSKLALNPNWILNQAKPETIKSILAKNGYDPVIKYSMRGTKDPLGMGLPTFTDAYAVLDKSAIKTKSQLTDIWNKAQSSDTINVSDFAKKVKAELLPLEVKEKSKAQYAKFTGYEDRALDKEIRGSVKNYKENLYESPIETSAGEKHFPGDTNRYFGHTRIEDMADNKTRRVIEVQSDLYQRGNLEQELPHKIDYSYLDASKIKQKPNNGLFYVEDKSGTPVKFAETKAQLIKDLSGEFDKKELKRIAEVAKLQQYNDPTAHFRMIREEIKKAAQDGKTKLQFPTGETIMKIEGLGQGDLWHLGYNQERGGGIRLTPDALKVGEEVVQGSDKWIITDVLGDGKFKAVPKSRYEELLKLKERGEIGDGTFKASLTDRNSETFDISGKVDTNNPIYKFYEKDVAKYLNKFGGKRVVDDKGVSWIEVPITKEQGKQAVEAFGKIATSPLYIGAGIGGAIVGGDKILKDKKNGQK